MVSWNSERYTSKGAPLGVCLDPGTKRKCPLKLPGKLRAVEQLWYANGLKENKNIRLKHVKVL